MDSKTIAEFSDIHETLRVLEIENIKRIAENMALKQLLIERTNGEDIEEQIENKYNILCGYFESELLSSIPEQQHG